jgi:hypothetical protein
MPIVTRTFLDQIHLQFAHGAEHQKASPGEIEGAHFIEIEYVVDDATGAIVGKTNNPLNGSAQVLDPAKVSDVLGAQFATFAAQLASTQTALNAATETAATQTALIVKHEKNIVDLTAALARSKGKG